MQTVQCAAFDYIMYMKWIINLEHNNDMIWFNSNVTNVYVKFWRFGVTCGSLVSFVIIGSEGFSFLFGPSFNLPVWHSACASASHRNTTQVGLIDEAAIQQTQVELLWFWACRHCFCSISRPVQDATSGVLRMRLCHTRKRHGWKWLIGWHRWLSWLSSESNQLIAHDDSHLFILWYMAHISYRFISCNLEYGHLLPG